MSDTVKLVIEISKSAYEEMSEYGTDRVDYDIQQMIKNGKPLSEVLYGFKYDVDENSVTIQENDGSYTQVISAARVKYLIDKQEYIIDKHISGDDSK